MNTRLRLCLLIRMCGFIYPLKWISGKFVDQDSSCYKNRMHVNPPVVTWFEQMFTNQPASTWWVTITHCVAIVVWVRVRTQTTPVVLESMCACAQCVILQVVSCWTNQVCDCSVRMEFTLCRHWHPKHMNKQVVHVRSRFRSSLDSLRPVILGVSV